MLSILSKAVVFDCVGRYLPLIECLRPDNRLCLGKPCLEEGNHNDNGLSENRGASTPYDRTIGDGHVERHHAADTESR